MNETEIKNETVETEPLKKENLNGRIIKYFQNGNIMEIADYKNGKLDGKNIYYFDGEMIFTDDDYKDGQLHGKSLMYRPDGKLWQEFLYKNGEMDGVQKTYYKDSGNLKKIEIYNNGKKENIVKYTDGEYERKISMDKLVDDNASKNKIFEEDYSFNL